MDYTNCPDCSAPTHSTTWEAFDGDTDGACWCGYCGWNDHGSAVRRRQIQRRNAAAAGLTLEQFKAQIKAERWAADEAFFDAQEARANQKEVA